MPGYLYAVRSLVLLLLMARGAGCDELIVPGSGNPEHGLGQLAKAFSAQQRRHHVTVPPSVEPAGALREIVEGTASLARVGRPFKPEESSRGLVVDDYLAKPITSGNLAVALSRGADPQDWTAMACPPPTAKTG